MSATVSLRPGTPDDYPFVLDTFAREYRHSPQGKPMGERLMRQSIEALLKSPRWTLTVAAPREGGDEIYGWILWAGKSIAWLHVKDMYRGHGFARVLLSATPVTGGDVDTPFVPHRTEIAANFPLWAESKGYRIRCRPHLILREVLNGNS